MTNARPTKNTIADLLAVMAALRTPGAGCPWDLEQTFQTIAPYTIEEAYEVADAIARGDLADLKDELGDLLLQVVYHARMAEEAGAFDFADVTGAIVTKMVRRHPHVFAADGTALGAEARAASAALAKDWWERIKAQEKAEKAAARVRLVAGGPGGAPIEAEAAAQGAAPSVLADVPVGLPALTRAVKLQDKAAKVGFDWPSLAPVFDKLKEEIGELEEVALPADPRGPAAALDTGSPGPGLDRIEEEFGDVLFVMANVARHLKIDPEAALRRATDKFRRRFGHIEARLAEDGRSPGQSTLEEMDQLWDEAKAGER